VTVLIGDGNGTELVKTAPIIHKGLFWDHGPAQSNSEQECTHREQTSADPENPDFGLWTPGSEV